VLLVFVPLISHRFRGSRAQGIVLSSGLAAFLAIGLASYFFHEPFDDWWYLRFLLPIYPLLLVLAAGGGWVALRRLPRRVNRWAPALFAAPAVLLVFHEAGKAMNLGVFDLQRAEQRYVTIGHDLTGTIPANAVILAMQQSGSLRYYAHRLTIRYDEIPPSRLVRAIHLLESAGLHPYLLLEDWEEPKFRTRFAKATGPGAIGLKVVKVWRDPVVVTLYDVTDTPVDRAWPAGDRYPPASPGGRQNRPRPSGADPAPARIR
jgi:hypothetical protein